jgi:hypothetical protein
LEALHEHGPIRLKHREERAGFCDLGRDFI